MLKRISIQNFKGIGDETKNAVLLEATRSIFGPAATGLLGGKSAPSDPGTRIVEIMKAVGPGS